MKDCMEVSLSKAELSLINAIRSIDDPDVIAEISSNISHPELKELKVSLLLIAADLIGGESIEKPRRKYA